MSYYWIKSPNGCGFDSLLVSALILSASVTSAPLLVFVGFGQPSFVCDKNNN